MHTRRATPQKLTLIAGFLVCLTLACGWGPQPSPTPVVRAHAIPAEAVKMTPAQDPWPPLAAPGWTKPQPLGAPVNTAGGEDSPFLTEEGHLYFFFTPDVRLPAERQVGDGVTGIWMTSPQGDTWAEPRRVILIEPGEPHLDGCPFVLDDWMAFCSVRAGNQREIDLYTAEWVDGRWTQVANWGEPINQEYRVGEFHLSREGRLYFSSDLPGGSGGLDLWVSTWQAGAWSQPLNLGSALNTPNDENRPFVTADSSELWFDAPGRQGYPGPSVFRSQRQSDGSWGPPEEIIFSFAGEPTLSADGSTLFFIHHYFDAELSTMIEADIYVSYRLDAKP